MWKTRSSRCGRGPGCTTGRDRPCSAQRPECRQRTAFSTAEIAAELFIAPKTASVHVSNILAKLGVSSRGEAAATAHRLRLFDPEPA